MTVVRKKVGVYSPDTQEALEVLEALHKRIMSYMKTNCLSQEEFGKLSDVSQSTLSSFLRTKSCSLAVFFKLVSAIESEVIIAVR